MDHRQRARLTGMCRQIHWDVDMSAYSTFRAGGVVEAMVEIADPDELIGLVRWLGEERIPWRVIGGGSNILVRDVPQEGIFIRLGGNAENARLVAEKIDDRGSCRVEVWAGTLLAVLVGWCTRESLAGLERLAGIPGTVGGAVRMNAGALGQIMADVLYSVRVLDEMGVVRDYGREEIAFSYRQSVFPGEPGINVILLRAFFDLLPMDSAVLAERNRESLARRKRSQPRGHASAGSFFKNPEGEFAGRLIERAGLKGLRQGNAMVSPKHANFIVNLGGARPGDILDLMRQVQEKVLQHSGIWLEPEVRIF